MQSPDAAREGVRHVRAIRGENGVLVVERAELQEEQDPAETQERFLGCWSTAAGDASLLPRGWYLARIRAGGDIEKRGIDPSAVIDVLERRSGKQRREEQHVAQVIQHAREMRDGSVPLRIGQLLPGQSAIVHIPAERR